MENLHKKIKSNMGRLFSTNISNFDFLIFKNNILDDNISTIGFTHGIIEDPFYYNSNIDNIYVNTNFDKKLMDEFSDIKNVKNLNIYGIKH